MKRDPQGEPHECNGIHPPRRIGDTSQGITHGSRVLLERRNVRSEPPSAIASAAAGVPSSFQAYDRTPSWSAAQGGVVGTSTAIATPTTTWATARFFAGQCHPWSPSRRAATRHGTLFVTPARRSDVAEMLARHGMPCGDSRTRVPRHDGCNPVARGRDGPQQDRQCRRRLPRHHDEVMISMSRPILRGGGRPNTAIPHGGITRGVSRHQERRTTT